MANLTLPLGAALVLLALLGLILLRHLLARRHLAPRRKRPRAALRGASIPARDYSSSRFSMSDAVADSGGVADGEHGAGAGGDAGSSGSVGGDSGGCGGSAEG